MMCVQLLLVDLNSLAEPFSKLPKLINPLPESTKPLKITRDEDIKSILKDKSKYSMENAKRLLFQIDTKKPRPKSGPVTYDQVVASVVREEQKIEKINDTGENEEKTGPKPVCCMMCALYCNSELE